MASGRSNSIDDELEDATECSICQEPFNDPRTLPCVHTFCLQCLERWTAMASGNGINCPMCRKQFEIPPEGLRGLPVNFFVEKLKNIRKELTRAKSFNGGSDKTMCDNHPRELAKVFCRDCCQPLCIPCFSESHKLHACSDVDKNDAEVRTLLKQDIVGLSETSRAHRQLIQDILKNRDHYCDHVTSVERLAVEKAEQLKDVIDRHLKKITDELKMEKENRRQFIGQIVDGIKKHTAQLESAKSAAEERLRNGDTGDVVKQVKSLKKIVESTPSIDTLRKTATCIDGARFTFVPSTVVPTNDGDNLVGKVDKQVIKGTKSNSSTSVVIAGSHPVRGVAVMGSELFVVRCPSEQHVEVYSAFTMSIDRRMQVPGLREATAMASCPSCVYVGDRVHTTIYRYDVASFRWTNWRLEKDNVPIGLSINKANNIVVTTYTKSSKLKEYNSTGSLVRVIHLASDIVRPWHAIQMPSGHFVVCHGNRETLNRVCVVNSDGRVIHSYGEKMTSGLLHEPSYLTIDKNGCILVCDSGNNRILVMNASLTVARGIAVSVEGGMQGPRVLCFDDSRGRLYVGEMTGCRVYNIL